MIGTEFAVGTKTNNTSNTDSFGFNQSAKTTLNSLYDIKPAINNSTQIAINDIGGLLNGSLLR